jgi:hypothetical protein
MAFDLLQRFEKLAQAVCGRYGIGEVIVNLSL